MRCGVGDVIGMTGDSMNLTERFMGYLFLVVGNVKILHTPTQHRHHGSYVKDILQW